MLSAGELTKTIGAYYKPGDPHRIWKLAGRTAWGSFGGTGAGVHGKDIALLKFDTSANDKIAVLASDGYVQVGSLTTATTGSLTTLTSGWSTLGENLAWCHYDDIWYLGNGYNVNIAYESDGTLRQMGMNPPSAAPTLTTLSNSYLERGSVSSNTGWSDPNNAVDNDTATAARAQMLSNNTSTKTIIIDSFPASTASDRNLLVRFSVSGPSPVPGEPEGPIRPTFQFRATVTVQLDTGSGYSTILTQTVRDFLPIQELSMPISVDSSLVAVKVIYTSTAIAQVEPEFHACNLYDVRVANSGELNFDSDQDNGYHYAIAEYDSTRDLEGPVLWSDSLTFTSVNAVKVTIPATANTDHTTHMKIYRTYNGATAQLGKLFLLAQVPVGQTEYVDTFVDGKDYFGPSQPPLLVEQVTDDVQKHHSPNEPPQPMFAMVEYKNFVVGLSKEFPRALYYSDPGFPESWPDLYVITDFPLKEHDKLTSLAVSGDLLIVGAEEALIVINGLPLLDRQILQNSDMTVLRGAPGCVGPKAMLAYSIHGETRVAWLSKFGLYETNGHQMWELGTDIDWGSALSGSQKNSFLYWDREEQLLYVGVDSDADDRVDRLYTVHMGDEHKKQNGKPKITGPHYARVANIVGGKIVADSDYHMYSVGNTDGADQRKVFNEKSGGTDETNAYDTSSTLPFDIKSGRMYSGQLQEWSVDFPTVRHMNFGSGANAAGAIAWTAGRDEIGGTDTVTNTISMSAQQSNKFFVARSGEWHEFGITHNGDSTTGGLLFIQADTEGMGETGDTQEQ
jgi:hypothetical protein